MYKVYIKCYSLPLFLLVPSGNRPCWKGASFTKLCAYFMSFHAEVSEIQWLCDIGYWRLVVKAQYSKIDPDTSDRLRKSLCCVHCVFRHVMHALKCNFFTQYLPAYNLGTAWRKNLVPGSYFRATQELLNGGWIMGIGWSKPECHTFSSACEWHAQSCSPWSSCMSPGCGTLTRRR